MFLEQLLVIWHLHEQFQQRAAITFKHLPAQMFYLEHLEWLEETVGYPTNTVRKKQNKKVHPLNLLF